MCQNILTGERSLVIADANLTGDDLLLKLGALANVHRLLIVARLANQRNYVSQLAREIGMSRPLLHMHLQRLEAAGLVIGSLELSDDGKAMKYYEVTPFMLTLTPERIAEIVQSPGTEQPGNSAEDTKEGLED